MAAVLFSFALAAALVVWTDRAVDPASLIGGIAIKACAIIAVAFAYMRLSAREVTLDHALFVGVTWLTLAMAIEIIEAKHLGHPCSALLGAPDSALRNILMFVWIGAPALFARGETR